MGYDYYGKIISLKSKQLLACGHFNYLKNLNTRSYSFDPDYIISTGEGKVEDFPEILKYYTDKFINHYWLTALDEVDGLKDVLIPYKKKHVPENQVNYLISEEDLELYKDKLASYVLTMEDICSTLKKETKEGGYFSVYVRVNDVPKGTWYKLEDFTNAMPKYKEQKDKAFEKLYKLKAMEDTPAYYEMSEEARIRYRDDLQYAEEVYEEYMYQYEAIQNIINLLGFYVENRAIEEEDENGMTCIDYSHDDSIELFIEVV